MSVGRPISVLNVLGELRPSGAEVMLLEAVPIMRDLGVEPSVVSTGGRIGEFAGEFRALSVPVYHVPFERSLAFGAALVQAVRHRRPDVVHVHTERANAAIGVTARASGARVVRTVHTVFSYTGRLRIVRTAERALLRGLGVRHIAIGRAVEENERGRLRNPTLRVDNWIGERFRVPTRAERAAARARLGVRTGAYVISSVGNCSSVKNHAAILGALPALADLDDGEVVYLHAGTGADEAGEKELARSLSGRVSVRFLGAVSDVLPVLWASDVFCMPSLYEGVGNAALEALASGVPAVLSDAAGMQDVHPEAPTVRFQPPTSEGVLQGICGLRATYADALTEQADRVARGIRSGRSVRTQVEALLRVYLGG